MRRALVLRHLAFEDLGRLRSALIAAGFEIRYVEVAGAAQQAADLFWRQWLAGLAPRVRVRPRAPLAA